MMKRFMLGSLLAATALLVLALTVGASSAVAKTYKCMVINDRLNTTYKPTVDNWLPVQTAIDAASPGDTLWIRGVCPGPLVIDKSLTLTGQQVTGYPAPPTIDAAQGAAYPLDVNSVVHVIGSDVQVQVNSLTLTHGGNVRAWVPKGGGIWNQNAHVTLNNVTISTNVAEYGGGIYNDHGTLEVSNSRIGNNVALGGGGGGIYTAAGTVTISGSEIANNIVRGEGGGAIQVNFGWHCGPPYPCSMDPGPASIVISDTKIHDNTAMWSGGGGASAIGGGIFAMYTASITLTGTTELTLNDAREGGGAFVGSGITLALQDSATIHDNTASQWGGGILAFSVSSLVGTVTPDDAPEGVTPNVYDNTPDNIYIY